MEELKSRIRHVPDFPKPGILFYDVTTLLRDPRGVPARDRYAVAAVPRARHQPRRRHREPRLHPRIGRCGSARRRVRAGAGSWGSCPPATVRASYDLEYGSDSLEMHCDAIDARPARADRRRPAGDRRHRAGDRRSGQAARGTGRGGRVPDRARGAERPRPAGRGERHGGACSTEEAS